MECAVSSLRSGSVVPDLTEVNLRDRDAVSQSIRDALGRFGGRDVIALLPDAAVRVVFLDFETLPSNHQEAEAVVRFRLKKVACLLTWKRPRSLITRIPGKATCG